MINKYTFPFLLLLLLSISSCENEIPFDKEANPPKLVMNALINADSINNILYLNKTGQDVISDVMEASVEVRVNDVLVETPKALPIPTDGDFISFQKRFLITTKFHPGDKVRIDAKTGDGAHHAWAEVTVPQPPMPIERVDTATVMVNEYDNYYTERLRYRITFSDRPGETNYYRLVLERHSTIHANITSRPEVLDTVLTRQDFRMLSREDVVLTDGHPTLSGNDSDLFEQAENIYGVFDDSRFSGQSYTMTVYSSASDDWPYLFPSHDITQKIRDCYVRLLSISETDYQYFKALNLIDSDVYDETIMEPIVFASNVHGGVGIVSISTETSVKINLVDEKYDEW
ncbi:DUF4249 domain-containing protein [Bacteroides sp.]